MEVESRRGVASKFGETVKGTFCQELVPYNFSSVVLYTKINFLFPLRVHPRRLYLSLTEERPILVY